MGEEGAHIAEEGARLGEDGACLGEEGAHLDEEGAHSSEEGVHLGGEGAHLGEDGAHLGEEGAHLGFSYIISLCMAGRYCKFVFTTGCRPPSPFLYRYLANAGRNHLKEEIIPLLPTLG
jgi:hypothetical protein